MEPYEKIYVHPSFLETEHGKIGCETCHGGNPLDPDWQTAHREIIKDPTFPSADEACGECHEEIVSTAKNSLHYTLDPFTQAIKARAMDNVFYKNEISELISVPVYNRSFFRASFVHKN